MTAVELTAADAQDLLSKAPWTTSAEDTHLKQVLEALAVTKLVIATTPDRTGVIVTQTPANTAQITFAYMPAGWAETAPAEHYATMPYSATMAPFVPPPGFPIVGAAALDSSSAVIGNYWAPRLTVTVAPPVPKPTASMFLGVDDGGWPMFQDAGVTSAAKVVRTNNASTEKLAAYEKAGYGIIDLLGHPNAGGAGAISAASLANEGIARAKAHPAIKATEILNEPQNPFMGWGSGSESQANIEAYAKLVTTVARAFTSAYQGNLANMPRLLFSADGGFKGVPSWGVKVWALLPGDVKAVVNPTVHPYGGHGSVQSSAEGNHARVREAYELTKRKVWVTEVGWPTALGKPNTGDSLQWTEAQQAENAERFVKWANAYCEAVIIFNYRDYGENNWYGIESHEGRKKPICGTMQRLQGELVAP